MGRAHSVIKQRKKRKPLTPDEVRGQDLLSFEDLRLFGIRYSKVHLYRLIAAGKFPRPRKIGPYFVAFVREEIIAYIEAVKRGDVAA